MNTFAWNPITWKIHYFWAPMHVGTFFLLELLFHSLSGFYNAILHCSILVLFVNEEIAESPIDFIKSLALLFSSGSKGIKCVLK